MANSVSNFLAGRAAGRDYALSQQTEDRQFKLNALAGQAYNAQGAERDALIGQAVGVDAQRGLAIGQGMDQRDGSRDGRLAKMAGVLTSAPPQVRPTLYKNMLPELSRMGYGDLPPEYSPDVDAFANKIASTYGGATATPVTPSLSAVERAYSQGLISEEEYRQAVKVAIDLAPGASAPGISYVDQWDPERQQIIKVPQLTRGLDYTGNAPTLGATMPPAGPTPPPAPQPQPSAGLQPDSAEQVILKIEEQDGPLPPDVRQKLAAQLRAGGEFTVANPSAAVIPNPQPAVNRPTLDRVPLEQYGGGDERVRRPLGNAVLGGPSGDEKVEQQRREAAASSQGRIEGERAAGPNFEQESSLRGEYLRAVSEPKVVIGAYNKVKDASTSGTAAGDMSMIFAYMKMLDPSSTVREGEYASARDTTGVPGQIINMYNKAKDGTFLSVEQRRAFVAQAATIAANAEASMKEANEYYSEIAPEYGIDPRRIIRGEKKAADAESYAVGDVVVDVNGRQYRVVGGDPADPDLEEL